MPNPVDKNEFLELEILKEVERSPRLSTRILAARLGCNIRLTHSLLKKLVEKGSLRVKKLNTRRWDYFLTPRGISEKARKTYQFFEFSMQFYQGARESSSRICQEIAASGKKTVAFIGAGSLAEIVYVSVQEWNLELIEVFGEGKREFLGYSLMPYRQLSDYTADAIIVCVYDRQHLIFTKYPITELRDLYWVFKDSENDAGESPEANKK